MRKNDLNSKRKRRYVVTTDSSHDSPIYPNVAKGVEVHSPDQLWVGDITYVAIKTGFVYLAVIVDAWSRKVVGYGLSLGPLGCLIWTVLPALNQGLGGIHQNCDPNRTRHRNCQKSDNIYGATHIPKPGISDELHKEHRGDRANRHRKLGK